MPQEPLRLFFRRLVLTCAALLPLAAVRADAGETMVPLRCEEVSEKAWEIEVPLPAEPVALAHLVVPVSREKATGNLALVKLSEKTAESERVLFAQVVNPQNEVGLCFQLTPLINEGIAAGQKSLVLRLANAVKGGQLTPVVVNMAESPRLRIFPPLSFPATEGPLRPEGGSPRVVAESVFPLAGDSGNAVCRLLFDPAKVEVVFSPQTGEIYQEGRDYRILPQGIEVRKEGKIKITQPDELFGDGEGLQMFPLNDGRRQVYTEGHWWFERQVAVTYDAKTPTLGDFPVSGKLPRTIAKLRAKEPVEVVIFGDSISVGAGATGLFAIPPYQHAWDELFSQALVRQYGAPVTVFNLSKGGEASGWARNVAPLVFAGTKPDLVIIGFGMNDRGNFAPKDFRKNIESIMKEARWANPDCDIILISSMEPNPLWGDQEDLPLYRKELAKLVAPGVAMADLTGITDRLLQRKLYYDLTSNGVNHPNDYLIRWYSKALTDLLSP